MKYLSKILIVFALFNFSAAMGGIMSTDVYLINKTHVPLIQDSVKTEVLGYPRKSSRGENILQTIREKKWVRINPGEKKKLFTIPRIILSPKIYGYNKLVIIRQELSNRGMPLTVRITRDYLFSSPRYFLPTSIWANWLETSYAGPKLQKKFVLKFGPYQDLHITALPNPRSGIP